MALVGQFRELESRLPDDWDVAHLRLIVPDEADRGRAAALLAPTNPGRRGKVIHFLSARRGDGVAPDRIRELLRRLDTAGIEGTLELVDVHEIPTPASPAPATLASRWDEAAAALPPDWSDLYGEVELDSTDYIEPAALRLSPLNPRRPGSRPDFRFRAARRFGYGASPEMVRRCLERLDEAGIRGDLRILQVLSDTHPMKTQGPVWYFAGEVV
jgi:hypothetical protein